MAGTPYVARGAVQDAGGDAAAEQPSHFAAGSPIDAVLARLEGARSVRPGEWRTFSPFQENCDQRTLAVKECDDGRVLLHDFAGHDVREVLEAIGLEFGDLFPGDYRASSHRSLTKPWRPTISARDALLVLSEETLVVLTFAMDMIGEGPLPSVDDYKRCREAVRRIQAVRACVR